MDNKQRVKKKKYLSKFIKNRNAPFKHKMNKRKKVENFSFLMKLKYIIVIFFTIIIAFNLNLNLLLNKTNKDLYNFGFLNIKTIHKEKFTNYNYRENIIVYKDLYNDVEYTPITESNSIIKSALIINESYFDLCENKTLLDNTKYKRSKKPKISVVIPYYNKDLFSLYIPLRSIQNQSLKDLEIIIVDDGSPENKLKEILEEMKNDNRIILLKHKENKGILMTRADGVRFASGEYILTMDQDDLYNDNHFFENIYKKAKELNVDFIEFNAIAYHNKDRNGVINITMPSNVIITQPELKIAFLEKLGKNRLGGGKNNFIWDKFVRREIYLKAIEDLGDEYLNHKIYLYEDTMMMFEFSQVAYSFYYYNISGYRLNSYNQGKSRGYQANNIRQWASDQLYYVKYLLYKMPPFYDRYHIFKSWGFGYCGGEAVYLENKNIDLLKEVLEAIDELERIYKNTDKELLECALRIKKHFGLI